MHGKPNPEEWRAIDFGSEYAAGHAHQRLVWLFSYDPYVALFGEDTYRRLANLIFSAECLGPDRLNITSNHEIFAYVSDALDRSPFGLLVSNQFKVHIITLVNTAINAGTDENGVLQ